MPECAQHRRRRRVWLFFVVPAGLPYLTSLLSDRTPRTFAGAGVGARALTPQRQSAAVAYASITTEVHQSLDAHRDFAAQIPFDGDLADFASDRVEVCFGQVLNLRARIHAGRFADALRRRAADAVDIGQRNDRVFVVWDVDTGDSRHSISSVKPCP